MDVITKGDFIKATGTRRFPAIASALMWLLKIDDFNCMMQRAGNLEGVAFTQFAIDTLGVTTGQSNRWLYLTCWLKPGPIRCSWGTFC